MASVGPVAGTATGSAGPVPAKKPLGGKRIDAKMAAAKRKAREIKERSKNGTSIRNNFNNNRNSIAGSAAAARTASAASFMCCSSFRFWCCLALAEGSSSYFSYFGVTVAILAVVLYRSCVPEHRPLVTENITATRIDLGNGRHLAVHEIGSSAESAKYHVLVLHDLKGCRLSMLPNISTKNLPATPMCPCGTISSQRASRSALIDQGTAEATEFQEWNPLCKALRDCTPVVQDYLVSKGIRLVSYDRPGYGQSDPNPARTAVTDAEDIKLAVDKLKLPREFHVVSLGLGSYVAWSLLKFIPERIESVATVSPWTSFRMESLKSDELSAAWHAIPRSERVQHLAARLGPWGVSALHTATKTFGKVSNAELPAWLASFKPVPDWLDEYLPHWVLETARSTFAVVGLAKEQELAASPEDIGQRDLAVLQSELVSDHLKLMEQEALLQGPAESAFRDLASVSADWGFDLSELTSPGSKFSGTVHVWIGTDDRVMPRVLIQYVDRVLPHLVVHEVRGGGHYFVYESEDWPKTILSTLTGLTVAEEALAQEVEASSKVYA